ncbi:MAG TPA: hypothetical protein PLG31_15120 [Spirochaetota bacterium]|nr:hypothetical protein [Spirochaetota bacterium]
MAHIDIPSFSLDKVTIRVSDHDGVPCVVFSGMMDVRDPSQEVLPYLLSIHQRIISGGFKRIRVDFSDLSFMNSSGIRSVISWVVKLNDLPAESRYRITIVHNPEITWQQSSLKVMQQLLPDHIELEKH